MGKPDRALQVVAEPLVAVLVTTTQDELIRGSLLEARPNALVLRGAAMAVKQEGAQAASWQALAGDTVIPMDRVHYYQVVPVTFLSN